MQLTLRQKVFAYIQLTRFDKPVGIELLLWATLWGLMLAGMGEAQAQGARAGLPPLVVFLCFATGAVLMRAAGCAINDFADRKVDGQVDRTKGRPLADGRLSEKEAISTFLILSLLSAGLLLFLPIKVFYWSCGAIVLAFVYPFMKRYTHLPQVILASAFGWSIPMGYIAVQGYTDFWCWLIFIAYMCWTVAYDTQYAMTDKPDDLEVGVKSTAILFEKIFGKYDVFAIGTLQAGFLILMALVFWHYFVVANTKVGYLPILALLPMVYMFIQQNKKCLTRDRQKCFEAFLDNIWIGRYMFVIVAGASVLENLL